MLNVETLNDDEYALVCDGEQIATIKRKPWEIDDVSIRLGTTKEGYTVAGMTLETLIIALVAKRVETVGSPADGTSKVRPVRSRPVRGASGRVA